MKITHNAVKCECAKKSRVIIELTEDEAANLAHYFMDMGAKEYQHWPLISELADEIIDFIE